MKTARTDTYRYQASHGKLPRGRGTWAFEVHLTHGSFLDVWASCDKTLAEARDEVLTSCGPENVAFLVVLP